MVQVVADPLKLTDRLQMDRRNAQRHDPLAERGPARVRRPVKARKASPRGDLRKLRLRDAKRQPNLSTRRGPRPPPGPPRKPLGRRPRPVGASLRPLGGEPPDRPLSRAKVQGSSSILKVPEATLRASRPPAASPCHGDIACCSPEEWAYRSLSEDSGSPGRYRPGGGTKLQ